MQSSSHKTILPVESDAHLGARRFRNGVRLLLVLSLISTVVTLLFARQVAYLAAIPLPFLTAILAGANYLEFRSRASILREGGADHLQKTELDADLETAGILFVLKLLGVLAMGTFIIAAASLDWQLVGVVAAAMLLLIVLINLPYLPLLFDEARRDELRRLRAAGHDVDGLDG
ncbi:hypothetical protein [Crateriforma spongiae]|uniref:hypothetical protein n=1 Tax=Crateriforma spongiae TaxID=2724528 RepID=UPI001F46FDA7|nr:hypothetical protein [Crateriforma spongiae]